MQSLPLLICFFGAISQTCDMHRYSKCQIYFVQYVVIPPVTFLMGLFAPVALWSGALMIFVGIKI